jgi:hypothetical protein
MLNTYSTTHFWSEKECRHLFTDLILDVLDYVPNCDVVFESCNVNCGGPLGGGKGEGESRGGEKQSGTNQGQVWTRIHTTRVKGGFPSK